MLRELASCSLSSHPCWPPSPCARLPVMDGWTAAGHLKNDAATKDIPIIALTAHAMAGDREKALEAGCDDYDTKPVEFKRLLGKIQAFVD